MMPINEDTGKGVERILNAGERNKWAFSLVLSVILNVYLLMRNDTLQDRITQIMQQNTKDQRDLLLISRGLKQLNDTINFHYEKVDSGQ